MTKERFVEICQLIKKELNNSECLLEFNSLCFILGRLCRLNDVIQEDEMTYIKKYFEKHRPKRVTPSLYWWRIGDIQSRIKFLNKMIKQYQDGN